MSAKKTCNLPKYLESLFHKYSAWTKKHPFPDWFYTFPFPFFVQILLTTYKHYNRFRPAFKFSSGTTFCGLKRVNKENTNKATLAVQSWGIPKGILSGNPFSLSAIAALTQWPGECRFTHHIKCMYVLMPPSTLLINIDKTYNIVLFMGLFNGEFNHNTYGQADP